MNTLLVVTTGQTDVQLVTNGRRREFSKQRCGELHAALEQRDGEWQIADAPEQKEHTEVKKLPRGSFDLCTPKLDAIINDLLNPQGMTVTLALILDTERDPQLHKGDPRMAGRILERRIQERFPTAIVYRVSFLVGDERLEDKNDPRDALIRREVVGRIDQVVAEVIRKYQPDCIVIAATGGFPHVCDLVEEVVRLHARGRIRVEVVEVPDGAKAYPPDPDRAVSRQPVFNPVEVYRAKRYALHLIEKGNLIAAWGAVQQLDGDEVNRQWTRVIEWLYCFAASLPLPEKCDIDLLRHQSMALRAALRVELALRADDIPRAVHGTVSFFEAAIWDHLYQKHIKNVHPTKPRLYQIEPLPPEFLLRGHHNPFTFDCEDGGVRWYRIHVTHRALFRLASEYLCLNDLTKFGITLSDEVRNLRHDVAHNEPTPSLMAKSIDTLRQAGIWSKDKQFLTQPLTRGVLQEIGIENPGVLCDELIKEVRDRLLKTPFFLAPEAFHDNEA